MRRPLAAIRARMTVVWLQVGCVIGSAVIIAAITEVALGSVHDLANRATTSSQASEQAAIMDRALSQVGRLIPARQGAATGPDADQLSAAVAVSTAEQLTATLAAAEELHRLIGSHDTLELLGASGDANDFLGRYLEGGRPEHMDAFRFRLLALRQTLDRVRPDLSAETASAEASLLTVATTSRFVTFGTVVIVGAILTLTTWMLGRRLRHTLSLARAEQERLASTTVVLERRNVQFQALYQIVTEVTETLSLKYVVRTAVQQARKLVMADMVGLRVLSQGKLVLAGSDQDVDADVSPGAEIELGTGSVGRAAKRGKTMRFDDDAEASFLAGEGILGARSGIIVPLIVGARVVGTLECWSRMPTAFSSDDEQILEMMASQVATAVISADTHEASERAAHHDALTGIPNRRQLTRDIGDKYAPAIATGTKVAFAMIDIDHFKRFNDDYGHKVGDVTLQRVAEVMRGAMRDEDTVYRYGGEEFTVVLQGVDGDEARQILDRMRVAVARTPLTGEEMQPVGPVTVSIGLAFSPEHGASPDMLITLADRALYQSKWAGRNQVTMFTPELLELPQAA